MKNNSQKNLFLNGAGDAFFRRNVEAYANNPKNLQTDEKLISYLNSLPIPNNKNIKVLEIGCGQGYLLNSLKKIKKWEFYGLDPSIEACKIAKNHGISAFVGTADNLPFQDKIFDFIIFGHCLYLCDLTDLFKIANETHRVSKYKSWICIIDFWSPDLKKIPYKHQDGIYSHKFDFSKIFKWHPFFTVIDHNLRHNLNFKYTDEKDEWTSITTLRKIEF